MVTSFIADPNKTENVRNYLPARLTELKFLDISPSACSTDVFILGEVHMRWALQRTKITAWFKAVLKQGGCDKKLNVIFLGKCAEECQNLASGDVVAFSGISVEKNTRDSEQEFEWQLTADSTKADTLLIVVLHRKKTTSPTAIKMDTDQQNDRIQVQQGSSRSYDYALLKDIKMGDTVNVYGVVKYIRPVTRTKGSDFMRFASIIDNSGGEKLKCLFFSHEEKSLPQITEVGQIVRLHRLKISSFRDEMQGQSSRGFSCLVFPGEVGASFTPVSNTKTFTLTQQDMDKVAQLREWACEENEVLSQEAVMAPPTNNNHGSCTVAACSVGQFFDLICQVIGCCPMNDQTFLLLVCDGTHPKIPVKEENLTQDLLDRLVIDEDLHSRTHDEIVNVYIFDNHVTQAAQLKPGDFIKLKNLHAAFYPPSGYTSRAPTAITPAELCLHGGGTVFGRGIQILNSMNDDIQTLKRRLGDCNDDHSRMNEKNKAQSVKKVSANQNPTTYQQNLESQGGTSSFNSDNRCMLTTAKVLTAHHDCTSSKLSEVQQHSVPYKFRVQCQVKDYMPHPKSASDLVRLHCQHCHYMCSCPIPDQNKNPVTSGEGPELYKKEAGLFLYSCPKCEQLPREDRILEYTIMLQLLLEDNTGWLVAGLWREQAVVFFHDTTATDILQNPKSFEFVQSQLERLCPQPKPSTSKVITELSKAPLIECCLKSYNTGNGTCYQMFDTSLAWTESDHSFL